MLLEVVRKRLTDGSSVAGAKIQVDRRKEERPLMIIMVIQW